MVRFSTSVWIDPEILRAAKQLQELAEEAKLGLRAVEDIPVDDIRAARNAILEIQPALKQAHLVEDALQNYRDLVLSAHLAVKEFEQVRNEILVLAQNVQSAFEAARYIQSKHWATLAAATGASITLTTALGMAATGGSVPIGQLPVVTLTDIATILAGEAGSAAWAAMTLAWHIFESTINDSHLMNIAIVIFAGLVSFVIMEGSMLGNIPKVAIWTRVAVSVVAKALGLYDDE